MNKHFNFLCIATLAGLMTACSTISAKQQTGQQTSATSQPAHAKPLAKRRHGLPEGVISLDIVKYKKRLHLLTGKHKQGLKTLWYQYSDDDGQSWSTASKLLNDDKLPAKMVRGNDAQISAQGDTLVVTWMKYVEGVRFNAGPMLSARSTDNGVSWQYSAIPADWKTGPHGYIDLAADDHALHAVWLDSRSGRSGVKASQALHYARSIDGGISWQRNATLDPLTCSCCWNTLKTDSEGNVYVLYRDKQPSDLAIGVINRQQHWQRLNHVGAFNWQFEGCPHIGGGIDFQTVGGKKRLHAVVGTGHEQHLGIHYLYSDDAGKNWSNATQLGDESALHADIAAHDNGRVIVTWDMRSEEGQLAVFIAESDDHGRQWSQPRQISKPDRRASHPRIVKTERGFLTLWTEHDGHQQSLATRSL